MAFRFANFMFEPVWNRNYIEHIQITAAEDIGIGSRAGYYDHAGALRDLVQNHMLQLLTLVCMEPPATFEAVTNLERFKSRARPPPLSERATNIERRGPRQNDQEYEIELGQRRALAALGSRPRHHRA